MGHHDIELISHLEEEALSLPPYFTGSNLRQNHSNKLVDLAIIKR